MSLTERLVAKESTDEEAKAKFITKYETDFYRIYRNQFDIFKTGTFSFARQYWSTLTPGGWGLFSTLGDGYSEWRERQHSP
jgi:hypothetical protein